MTQTAGKIVTDMDNFVQSLRDVAIYANRVATQMEQHVTLPAGTAGEYWHVQNPPVDLVPHLETAPVAPRALLTYPILLDKVTVNWGALRMVVSSRLSKLINDGVYKKRVDTDRGYAWLAEQIGVSNHTIRDFLTDPNRVLGSEAMIRMCRWVGCPVEEFIDDEEDE